ncbi:MAG: hypothetical protein M1823_001292 [Watsoniomyces obsoletus]|nr:MAG: hypothetical protein M1823_001292 [Watsoniomyces obsoletus]
MQVTRLFLLLINFGAILATPALVRRARKDPVPVGPGFEWILERATLDYGDKWGYNWVKHCAQLRYQVAVKAREDSASMELKETPDNEIKVHPPPPVYDDYSLQTCLRDYRELQSELPPGQQVPPLTLADEEARYRELKQRRSRSSTREDGESGRSPFQISSSDLDTLRKGARQAWEDRPKVKMASLAGAAMYSLKTVPKQMVKLGHV